MTLKEFLEDYATDETKAVGEALIEKEIENIGKEKVKEIVRERLKKIEQDNKRDFYF